MTEQRCFKHWADLNEDGKKLYGKIWENGTVPVVSMIPTWCKIEGQVEQCYLISHEEMTPEQISIMLDILAVRFGAPKSVIEDEMKKNHLPLRAKYVGGAGTNQMGLFLPDFPDEDEENCGDYDPEWDDEEPPFGDDQP
jgi:hypothetical protein